jgi:hypothetical protein
MILRVRLGLPSSFFRRNSAGRCGLPPLAYRSRLEVQPTQRGQSCAFADYSKPQNSGLCL